MYFHPVFDTDMLFASTVMYNQPKFDAKRTAGNFCSQYSRQKCIIDTGRSWIPVVLPSIENGVLSREASRVRCISNRFLVDFWSTVYHPDCGFYALTAYANASRSIKRNNSGRDRCALLFRFTFDKSFRLRVGKRDNSAFVSDYILPPFFLSMFIIGGILHFIILGHLW